MDVLPVVEVVLVMAAALVLLVVDVVLGVVEVVLVMAVALALLVVDVVLVVGVVQDVCQQPSVQVGGK